jgi:hypothetical protein
MVLRRKYWYGLLFLVAFGIRVTGVLVTHQYRDLERFELERVAISLASGDGFANPYAIPTGPTAHVSPGYPLLLALIFKLFGTGQPAEMVKQVLACAITAVQCTLMPVVARRIGFGWRVGMMAGWMAALLPVKFKTETMGDWESPYAAMALMLVTALTVLLWMRRDFTARRAVLTGLAWGVSLLFSYSLVPLYFALLATGFLLARPSGHRQYARFCLVETAVVALCMSPWIVRNQLSLGAPVVGRTNAGLELRISNNDVAGPSERLNYENGVYHVYHPLQNVEEARKVRDMGEVAYNQMAMSEAREWIVRHPGRFARLTLGRIRLFWFSGDGNSAKGAIVGGRVVLGFAGLAFAWRAHRIAASVLGLILLVVPVTNYLVHVGPKHSYPIDWVLTLLAAFGIVKAYYWVLPQRNARA